MCVKCCKLIFMSGLCSKTKKKIKTKWYFTFFFHRSSFFVRTRTTNSLTLRDSGRSSVGSGCVRALQDQAKVCRQTGEHSWHQREEGRIPLQPECRSQSRLALLDFRKARLKWQCWLNKETTGTDAQRRQQTAHADIWEAGRNARRGSRDQPSLLPL